MKIEMYGMQFDLNDDIDCMFIHDRTVYENTKPPEILKTKLIYLQRYTDVTLLGR